MQVLIMNDSTVLNILDVNKSHDHAIALIPIEGTHMATHGHTRTYRFGQIDTTLAYMQPCYLSNAVDMFAM